jgi:uncharacterized membrane protein YecN with MAPEG domain
MGRVKTNVMMGDGGNNDMVCRMRTLANFSEFVPLLLILMGLMEMGGGNRTFLEVFGAALVVLRIMHAIGMPRPVPNVFRAGGFIGTFVLLLVAAVYSLILTWHVWSPAA